jgi:Resolvase, N terminal domain
VSFETADKVAADHLRRDAYLYVRQSTLRQVLENTTSTQRQYGLRQRAMALGWPAGQVVVIDDDLGRSGAAAEGRDGFQRLVADVGMGKAGIVIGLEVSRLARNNADWHRLLGAPRGAVYSRGDVRAPPPGRRSGLVKLEAA